MTANATDTAAASAASRLCTACGLCCNGVMFHTVRLQPLDSAKGLAALGMKLKHKSKGSFIQQPCPALSGSRCTMYEHRPQRCRLFECRQLVRLAAGETSEASALEAIREVQRRVEHLETLLQNAGKTDPKRPLSKRCDKIMAEPLPVSAEASASGVREDLAKSMQQLNDLLNRDFRLQPVVWPAASVHELHPGEPPSGEA